MLAILSGFAQSPSQRGQAGTLSGRISRRRCSLLGPRRTAAPAPRSAAPPLASICSLPAPSPPVLLNLFFFLLSRRSGCPVEISRLVHHVYWMCLFAGDAPVTPLSSDMNAFSLSEPRNAAALNLERRSAEAFSFCLSL